MDDLLFFPEDKFFVSVAFGCGFIDKRIGGHTIPLVIAILNILFAFCRGLGTHEFTYAIFMLTLYGVAFFTGGWIAEKTRV